MKRCINCGNTTYLDDNFCSKCGGSSFLDITERCVNGHIINKYIIFCSECGVRIKEKKLNILEKFFVWLNNLIT